MMPVGMLVSASKVSASEAQRCEVFMGALMCGVAP
jgi:hypothetical protein